MYDLRKLLNEVYLQTLPYPNDKTTNLPRKQKTNTMSQPLLHTDIENSREALRRNKKQKTKPEIFSPCDQ